MTIPILRRIAVTCQIACSLVVLPYAAAGPVHVGSSKDTKAVTLHDTWSLPGILGGGVKTTDEYTEGNLFLVLPVYSTIGRDARLSGDVFFVEPYSSWGEDGEVAASLGLGWRHLFSTQGVEAITRHDGHQAGFFEEGVYVGANVFVDMLDTQFDNQFWQLGVGVEVGTRYLEARANYYIPLSDRELAFERRSTQTFSNSSTSTSQSVTPLNNPYATGNTIAQDANFTTLATTTTTTTTIEQLFRLYEEGMEGWDVEASLLIPGLDRYMDVKLIGGYYSFDNQPFGPQTGGTGNVEGWKAGVEVRPVPAVALTATWYEDERFVGSDWLYGARLEIPFEMGDLGDGKGFWGRVGDAFRPRRRHLAERLVEPVRRQNEAVKIGNSSETETDISTSTKRVTRVVSSGPRHIILVDDVIFVNNDGPTGNGIQTGSDLTGTGTAEQPFETIQTGATTAQTNSNTTARVWNVYTQGTPAGYTGNVVATTGSVNFIGSGRLIPGLNGTTFGTGPAPALTGGFRASGISYFGITAYNIFNGLTSGDDDGIRLLNVQTFLIDGNTIDSVLSDAVDVRSNGTNFSSGIIVGNSIIAPGDAGLELDAREGSTLTILALNNEFTGGPSDVIKVSAREAGTMNFTATGNSLFGGGSDAFDILATEGGTINLTAINNEIFGFAEDGVYLFAEEGATLHANISDNRIAFVGDDAIDFDAFDGAVISLRAERNQIGFIADYGIATEMYNDATGTAEIHDNQITFVGTDAVQFFLTGSDVSLTANVNRNTINSISSDGIDGNTLAGAELIINAADNVLTGLDGDGFDFQTSTFGDITATLTNNTINDADNGMFLRATLGGQLDVGVVGGSILNSTTDGIDATTDFGTIAQLDLVVTGTSFVNNNGFHIQTRSGSQTTLNSTITSSSFVKSNGSTSTSIFATSDINSNQSLIAVSNTITAAPGSGLGTGIEIVGFENSDFSLNLVGNTITGINGDGIRVLKSTNTGTITGTISQNTISNLVLGNGITINMLNGGSMDLAVTNNNISNLSSGAGISLTAQISGTINAAISGNSISNIITPSSGMYFSTSGGGGVITVTGFDGNSILGVSGDGLYMSEAVGGTLTIDGTLNTGNNIINNVTGLRVNDDGNGAGGQFHLGPPVNTNRAPDTDVP